jgi:hypothetical protein
MNMNMNKILLIGVLMSVACAASGASPGLSENAFKPAVEGYLAVKGDFCLGKFHWPIVVTETDLQQASRDAIQMPVLERLGLVASSGAPNDPNARSYDLTPEGKKYYLHKKTFTQGPLDAPVEHPGDFCAARLKLNRVVDWRPVTVVDGREQTTVSYTYKLAFVAPWARDPAIQKVFPMVARIVSGEGTQRLVQAFARVEGRWVAVTPGS